MCCVNEQPGHHSVLFQTKSQIPPLLPFLQGKVSDLKVFFPHRSCCDVPPQRRQKQELCSSSGCQWPAKPTQGLNHPRKRSTPAPVCQPGELAAPLRQLPSSLPKPSLLSELLSVQPALRGFDFLGKCCHLPSHGSACIMEVTQEGIYWDLHRLFPKAALPGRATPILCQGDTQKRGRF